MPEFRELYRYLSRSDIPNETPLISNNRRGHDTYPSIRFELADGQIPGIEWGGDKECDSIHFEFTIAENGITSADLHWGNSKPNPLAKYFDQVGIEQDSGVDNSDSKIYRHSYFGQLNFSSFDDNSFREFKGTACIDEIVGRSWHMMISLYRALKQAYDIAKEAGEI